MQSVSVWAGIRRVAMIAFAALACGACMSGCAAASGFPDRTESVEAELSQLQGYFADDIWARYNEKTGREKQEYRDLVVHSRLRAIDLQYGIFVRNVTGGRLGFNVSGDLAVLGLSAAGTLVPTASTKAILAAISGGIVGTRAVIDKEVFYDQTVPVLFQTMAASRRALVVRVRDGLGLVPEEYGLAQALADLEDYYHAGTFLGATIEINNAAGNKATKAEAHLTKLYTVNFSAVQRDAQRDVIREWLLGRDDEARAAVLTPRRVPEAMAWLEQRGWLGDSPTPVTWIESATREQLDQFISEVINKKNP